MMRLRITLESTTLLRPVEVVVVLPSGFNIGKAPYRTIWALHCAMSNADFFFDSLRAGDIAKGAHIAIIAPSLGNGYFLNSVYERQADFLQDELMPTLQEALPLSLQRDDNFIIGVSMGGFGALRWGLDRGENFAAVAAISGVFDPRLPLDERVLKKRAQRALHVTCDSIMRRLVLDESGQMYPDADLNQLVRHAGSSGRAPRLELFCGEQDYLSLSQSQAVEMLCREYRLPARLHTMPGEHDPAYWQKAFCEAVSKMLCDA